MIYHLGKLYSYCLLELYLSCDSSARCAIYISSSELLNLTSLRIDDTLGVGRSQWDNAIVQGTITADWPKNDSCRSDATPDSSRVEF